MPDAEGATFFTMPSLGADMESGTLLEWLVEPGDRVERGQVIAVVDTEKAAIEVETWVSGVVDELLVEPGMKVPVGEPLATIVTAETPSVSSTPTRPAAETPPPPVVEVTEPGAAAPATYVPVGDAPEVRPTGEGPAARHARRIESGSEPARAQPPAAAPVIPASDSSRVRASPRARRLAAERGVDLEALAGSGPAGAVIAADVEAARSETASGLEDRRESMRRAIAAAMERSKREIPHYYLATRVDMSAAMRWLAERNRTRPARDRIVPSALVLRALALAASEIPELNGYWEDGRFRPGEGVHTGMVVALPRGGVLVPAILDADRKPLHQLMPELRDLVARARRGRLRGSELTAATITLTALGEGSVEAVYGVIYPPQVALVGAGSVVERPWAEHGVVEARPQITLTLSADHRASDGRSGARFLDRIARLLQDPASL